MKTVVDNTDTAEVERIVKCAGPRGLTQTEIRVDWAVFLAATRDTRRRPSRDRRFYAALSELYRGGIIRMERVGKTTAYVHFSYLAHVSRRR